MKCGLSLENMQPSPFENDQPIRNSRSWSTEPHQIKSFNNFAYFNLRDSKLKRIINNGMNGISWHFIHFLYISVKILNVGDRLIW